MTEEQVTNGGAKNEEVAPVYTDMFGDAAPPAAFKTYRSARLSLDQINAIMADAYDNKVEAGDSIVPDYGGARIRFEQDHEIQNGLWVAKGDVDSTSSPE